MKMEENGLESNYSENGFEGCCENGSGHRS